MSKTSKKLTKGSKTKNAKSSSSAKEKQLNLASPIQIKSVKIKSNHPTPQPTPKGNNIFTLVESNDLIQLKANLQELEQMGQAISHLTDSKKRTLLHHAIQGGHWDGASLLLSTKFGETMLFMRDQNGLTPLHYILAKNEPKQKKFWNAALDSLLSTNRASTSIPRSRPETRNNGISISTGGVFDFHSLPDDLIFHIFSFLSPRELLNTSLVSKNLCSIALEPYLWKSFCKYKYGSQMNTSKYSATSSNRWMTMYKEQNGWKPANFSNPQTFSAYRDWHRVDKMLLNDDLLFTYCLSHAQPIRIWDLKKIPKQTKKAPTPLLELPETITQIFVDKNQIFCLGKGEIQIRERGNVLKNVHSIKWDLLSFENPQVTNDLLFVSVENYHSKSIHIRDKRRLDYKLNEISTDNSWSTFKVMNENLLVAAQLGRAFGMFLYDKVSEVSQSVCNELGWTYPDNGLKLINNYIFTNHESKDSHIIMWDIRNLGGGPVQTYHVGVGGPVLFEVDADKIVGINCYYRIVQWDLVTKERVILLKLPLLFSERDRAPCSIAMDYKKVVASWEHNVSIYTIL